MIKPDGMSRNLSQEIKNRIYAAGLKIVKEREFQMDIAEAEKLYAVHEDKPFHGGLCRFITSGLVTTMLIQGKNAVSEVRKLMGATDPREALPGTIRGDLREGYVLTDDGIIKNIVHGSDSPESAKYESAIFF